jgi:hypothetical protein
MKNENFIIKFSIFPGNAKLSKEVYLTSFTFYCPFHKTSAMSTSGSFEQARLYPEKIAKKILKHFLLNNPTAQMIAQ